MQQLRTLMTLFVTTAAATGLVFWWQADWWYYVGIGPERWPKFKAPVWEQVAVSTIVGSFVGAVVVGVVSQLLLALAVPPNRSHRQPN